MLTAADRPTRTASRIRGQASIVASLIRTHRAVQRFAEGRARTDDERTWSAIVSDRLMSTLQAAVDFPRANERIAAEQDRRQRSRKCCVNRLTLDADRQTDATNRDASEQ